MGFKAVLQAIHGPAGIIPAEVIVQYATQVPQLRDDVIKRLQAAGYLEAVGLKPLPWYVRLWRRLFSRAPALTQGT